MASSEDQALEGQSADPQAAAPSAKAAEPLSPAQQLLQQAKAAAEGKVSRAAGAFGLGKPAAKPEAKAA